MLADSPTEQRGLTSLHPGVLREWDDNPRYISDEALERLQHALTRDPSMMEARPLIATPNGVVIAGNMRLRAVQELGWSSVPVFIADLDATKQREWALRDNQEYGDWVPDQLAAIIAEHQREGADMLMLGFDDEEVEKLLRRASGEALVPEPSESPDPTLASEVMIEIRCTKVALAEISDTLEEWQASIDDLEIGVSS